MHMIFVLKALVVDDCCGPGAADREELSHNPHALDRKRAVARLVLGEDEDAAGGLDVDQSFVTTTLSSASCVSP